MRMKPAVETASNRGRDARQWLLATAPRSRMQARLGRAYLAWRRFVENRLAVIGLAIIVLLVAVAALAPALAPYPPNAPDLTRRLAPPGQAHWLGTDELGRDIFSRIIHGSRLTLYVVVLVALIAAPAGLVIGTAAGYAGGWVDTILMRITDIFLAFPKLILALAFVSALGPGIENAIIAIAVTAWPPYARIARAVTAMAMMAFSIPGPRAATKARARMSLGKARKMSVMRIRSVSTKPPA